MSLLRYIRDNQQLDADRFFITRDQLRRTRNERALMRRKAWGLVREFKRIANKNLEKTAWNKPYRAMKDYLKDRTK